MQGSTIAIDLAMPKIEEEALLEGSFDTNLERNSFNSQLQQLGLMPPQRI